MTLQEGLGATGKFNIRGDRRMNLVIGLDIAKEKAKVRPSWIKEIPTARALRSFTHERTVALPPAFKGS